MSETACNKHKKAGTTYGTTYDERLSCSGHRPMDSHEMHNLHKLLAMLSFSVLQSA